MFEVERIADSAKKNLPGEQLSVPGSLREDQMVGQFVIVSR